MRGRRPRRVARPDVREGYDRWADSYDRTPNPIVAADRRFAPLHLRARAAERILDAGCGTGAHLRSLLDAGCRPVGLDFSRGMLVVARRAAPGAPLVRADLGHALPFAPATFDAFLCSLVSEHLTGLGTLFAGAFAVLRPGGRLACSAFHPELAAAGIEANFEVEGTEFRLGAERHTVGDYVAHAHTAGFRELLTSEYDGDPELLAAIPSGHRYVGRPLLLVVEGRRPPS